MNISGLRRVITGVTWIKRQKGFTLLEVIFSMTILCIGLLAIATLQASAIRGNAFAGSVSEGTSWAVDKIEKLNALSLYDYYDSSLEDTDGDGNSGLDDTAFDDNPSTQADADHQEVRGDYTVYWNISSDILLNNTKTINIIVVWNDHGVEKNISMQYVISRII